MSQNPRKDIQSIKDRIHGGGAQKKELTEEDIPEIHHIFMKEYGWIPVKEFGNLLLPTFFNLMGCISNDREQEQKEYDKAKRKR